MGCTAERTDQTASLVRMADAQQLSQAAFDRLKADYDDLTTRGRIDIARKIEAARELVSQEFHVMVYCSDDPRMCVHLAEAGVKSVMPAGSPIGSGQGILNPNAIRIIQELVELPVIVDAGVGTASDVAVAMELGVEGVLLNTAIASAREPLRMAVAMRQACEAGRHAFLAGRIPRKLHANASSPVEGTISGAGPA